LAAADIEDDCDPRLRACRRRGCRAGRACGSDGDPGGRKAESHARVAHRL